MIRKFFLKTADGFRLLEQVSRRLAGISTRVDPYILAHSPTSEPQAHIVHVNGNFIVGGNTQLIVDIIERTSNVYSHEVIVPVYPRPLPYQPVNICEFALNEMPALFEHLKTIKPDLVHMNYWVRHETRHDERALWFQAVFGICEELNIPVLQNVTIPAEPYISPAVIHNVFVSEFVAKNFNVDRGTPWSVIYPGSDFRHFSNENVEGLPGDAIGMVYRLDQDKLNAEAIEVFIAALKKKPSLTSHIIGDGHYLDSYKRRVKDEGLSNRFFFHGAISYARLPEYYKKFSVFVAPVYDESFGQVTPFAMSMGQVVAGFQVGALPEILGNLETLVPAGSVDALSELIVEITNDKRSRIALGRKNQLRAIQYFSVEKMIEEYQRLYRKSLKLGGVGA